MFLCLIVCIAVQGPGEVVLSPGGGGGHGAGRRQPGRRVRPGRGAVQLGPLGRERRADHLPQVPGRHARHV